MFIPDISLKPANFDDWARHLVRQKIEGSLAFKGWFSSNGISHSFPEFFQPELNDKLQ
jgi:hypothetical protein